jgi:hypothetical protein
MPRFAPLLAVLACGLLSAGCPRHWRAASCPAPGLVDCDLAGKVRLEALRARTWMLDAPSFGRRDAPEPGADRAAHFMAAEMQALGLAPAGANGTYLQEVPLRVDEPRQASFVLSSRNVELTLMEDRDFAVLEAHGETRVLVDAEIVMADGAVDRQARGRVGVITARTPGDLERVPERLRALARHGAPAALVCTRGPAGRDTYAAARKTLTRPSVRLAEDEPAVAATPAAATAPEPRLKLVLALAAPACEELLAAGGAPSPARPVLGVRLRAHVRLVPRPARACNAVAVYRPDRDRGGTPLVVAAPLDGPGLDLAGLLEVGRTLTLAARKPARPVIVLAYAAAAGGPVGLRHYSRHPTVARAGPTMAVSLQGSPLDRAVVGCARVAQALINGEGLVAGAREP